MAAVLDCYLLSAADNLESTGQANEASSLHPSTAGRA
jgi:hypothetical protein